MKTEDKTPEILWQNIRNTLADMWNAKRREDHKREVRRLRSAYPNSRGARSVRHYG